MVEQVELYTDEQIKQRIALEQTGAATSYAFDLGWEAAVNYPIATCLQVAQVECSLILEYS